MNSESHIDPKEELSARLVRLENRNKLLMRWNFLLVAIVCSMLFIGWKSYTQPISEWVDCQGISVKDAGGRTRAMLSVKGNETIMQFYDATGKVTWSAPPRVGIKPIGN